MPTDFYEVLGIPPDATTEEVRAAYRECVKRYHPDVNDHPRAHAQFKVLNRAKDVLTDPIERDAYDRLGHRGYVRKRLEGELPTTDFPRPSNSPTASPEDPTTTATPGASTGATHVGPTGTSTGAGGPGYTGERSTNTRAAHQSTRPRGPASSVDRLVPHLWLAVTLTVGVYFAAVGAVVHTHLDTEAVRDLSGVVASLPSAPAGAGSTLVTSRFGVPKLDALFVSFDGGSSLLAVLAVASMVALVVVLLVAVAVLRRRTVWRASWAYPVGAAAPLLAVVINAFGVAILAVDVILVVIVPAIVLTTFLYHRFS